jgi:hypothetical protein
MTENGTFFGTKSAFFGYQNMTTLKTFFFSRKPIFFLFHNFNTATHGGLKNQNLNYFFDFWHGASATCLEWVRSKKLVFGAYLQFLFVNASMMTENETFFGTKSASFGTQNMTTLETFIFSRKPNFFVLQL